MPDADRSPADPPPSAGDFAATHWTLVLAAARTDPQQAGPALEALFRSYWYPVYAFVRRQGHAPHDAEDLTQSFFASLIERDALRTVAPAKGRFRSFILAVLTNYLHNERDRAQAHRRGGGRTILAWDALEAEERYRLEPVDKLTPDRLFERRWAFTLVERVLARLQAEYVSAQKGRLFTHLQPLLTTPPDPGQTATIADALGLSEGACKVALHRLRRRFGELLRSEIAHTVSRPEEVDEELRHLCAALADARLWPV